MKQQCAKIFKENIMHANFEEESFVGTLVEHGPHENTQSFHAPGSVRPLSKAKCIEN